MILTDFTYNGITFKKLVRSSGFRAELVDGSQVGIRDTITSMPAQDGVERHRSFYQDRLFEVRGYILGSSSIDLYANKNTLESAFDIHNLEASTAGTEGFLPLNFTEPGQNPACFYLKPIKGTIRISERRTGFALGFSVLLEARDPKKYEQTFKTFEIVPNISGGSSGFPVAFPVAFAGTNLSGSTTIDNTGGETLPSTITVTGPCTAPKLENTTTGEMIGFSSDLVLLSGESLVINFDNGTCYKVETNNNQVNVIHTLLSAATFWSLESGNNDIIFSAATMSLGCTASIKVNFTVR